MEAIDQGLFHPGGTASGPKGQDLVTIITATLNNGPMLRQAIQSVREQTYWNIEHIVVDGLSTDETTEILEEYKRNSHGKVVVVRERDAGMYDAINKGLALANGWIIGILNSDDFYCRDALENVVDCFVKTKAGLVYGNIMKIQHHQEVDYCKEVVANEGELSTHMSIPHPGVFVTKATYDRYGCFDTRYKIAADYELLLRLRDRGTTFAHLDRIVCNFRRGGMSERQLWRVTYEAFLIQKRYFGQAHAGRILLRRSIEYSVVRWIHRVTGSFGAPLSTREPKKSVR
jgi:glycosyltransferase involved in cell wall biosynthesis